jgi:hypothetical protein
VAKLIQLYGYSDPRTALADGRGAGILHRENDARKQAS